MGFGGSSNGANFAPQNTKLAKKCVLRTGIISTRKMRSVLAKGGAGGGAGQGKEKISRVSEGSSITFCRDLRDETGSSRK